MEKLKKFWRPGKPDLVKANKVARKISGMKKLLPQVFMGVQKNGNKIFLKTRCGYFNEELELGFFPAPNKGGMSLSFTSEGCAKKNAWIPPRTQTRIRKKETGSRSECNRLRQQR